MQSFESLLAEVERRWRQQGLKLAPRPSESALRDFEARFRVQCPEDFATYLLTLGGMPDGTWDEHLIRFWPLAEIRPAAAVTNPTVYADYFVFADYSISAHEYGIRLLIPPRPDVALIGGPNLQTIAPTFEKFLTVYLSDPRSLFYV